MELPNGQPSPNPALPQLGCVAYYTVSRTGYNRLEVSSG